VKAAFKDTHHEERPGSEPRPRQRQPQRSDSRLTDADIAAMNIEWHLKGMRPAPEGAHFCFAFATDREGYIRQELQPLLDELSLGDKITVGAYEYKLGERDNNLISRNKAKRSTT